MGLDVLVALHNTDVFYQRDIGSEFQLSDKSLHYYVDYQVKHALEQIKGDN